MPGISNTDLRTAARYLRDAARHYEATAQGKVSVADRARLMRLMATKLEKKDWTDKRTDMKQTRQPIRGTRRKATVRCHDCLHADICQRGNNPSIARCRADPARPPQVAMARIVCGMFQPNENDRH